MPKLLYLVTEDWYFLSHRLALARAAHDAGADVYVMTRLTQPGEPIRRWPFQIISWPSMRRGSTNVLREVAALREVVHAYQKVRPDLVHHVAIKPALYGGLAARMVATSASVTTIAGMGEAFTSDSSKSWLLRTAITPLMRVAFMGKQSQVVVQNQETLDRLNQLGLVPRSRLALTRGSGVDPDAFPFRPEPQGIVTVVLASRMLRSKGVAEFVEAARIVRQRRIHARFVLVGDTDPQNPSSIARSQLRDWADEGYVEWWGHREDIANVLAHANIVCLPSYAEGVPRILIEAASSGRAIVTANVPGCRDVVRDGENGLVVPPRDPVRLAEAIVALIQAPEQRARMGARGREIVLGDFSEAKVIAETFAIYRKVLGGRWPPATAAEQFDALQV